jgi:hypothetical protein
LDLTRSRRGVIRSQWRAAAGKEAGLKAILNMSQGAGRPDHPGPSSRQHWLSERIFDWDGTQGLAVSNGTVFTISVTAVGEIRRNLADSRRISVATPTGFEIA